MDRGYLDFSRLYRLHQAGAFFVTRSKTNTRFVVMHSRTRDKTTGLRCDQTIKLSSAAGRAGYPAPLRRISYVDPENGNALVFITNQFELGALMIPQVYRRRWAIEWFFRWIKQHLRLRGFYSTSFNGVRVQIWSALCAFLLVAIAKRRLLLPLSLWEILQIISVASMEQIALSELIVVIDSKIETASDFKQLEINYS